MDKTLFVSEMGTVAAGVQQMIRTSILAGLSPEAASLAAMIGVVGFIRVEGLAEHTIIKDACRAVPVRYQHEAIQNVKG